MRLIDADALKEGLKEKMYGHPFERTFLSGVVDSEPTIDAIHVVRCRECKKKNKKKCPMTIVNFGRDGKEILVQNHVPDDFYCAAGERKEGAD